MKPVYGYSFICLFVCFFSLVVYPFIYLFVYLNQRNFNQPLAWKPNHIKHCKSAAFWYSRRKRHDFIQSRKGMVTIGEFTLLRGPKGGGRSIADEKS